MTMANYGFNSSNEVQLDTFGFPIGNYVVHAVGQGNTATGILVDYKFLTGEHANKGCSVYYNTLSDNDITAKIAKQDIKRIGDATGRPVVNEDLEKGIKADPIAGRTFMVEVEANAKNPRFTNVRKYLPADGIAPDFKKGIAEVAGDIIPF